LSFFFIFLTLFECIDVTGGVNADGTKLQIWTCTEGNTNQQWISVSDFTFQWSGTNKCIDLSDGKITDGNQLQIWTCDDRNANQQWIGEPNPDTTELVLCPCMQFNETHDSTDFLI
jgi:hypothetical protein